MGGVRVDIGVAPSKNERRCSLSRKKKFISAALLVFAIVIVVAIAVSIPSRSKNESNYFANTTSFISTTPKGNADPIDSGFVNPSDGVAETKIVPIDGNPSNSSGNDGKVKAKFDDAESSGSNTSEGAAKTKVDPVKSNASNHSDDAAKTKIEPAQSSEINAVLALHSGNVSDFIMADLDVLRKSAFNAANCPLGEGLWSLSIVTDDYPWETKWELHADDGVMGADTIVALGPPEGSNYERRTRYTGNLCLPTGRYRLRWFDAMEDGMCCDYGRGGWTVRVDRETVLENDPYEQREDSNAKRRDFLFQVTGTISDEVTGTFLLPRANVEFPDGTIFELANLPPDFDYADAGLVSGFTSIVLPAGTDILSNATANMKGRSPRVAGSRILLGRGGNVTGATPSNSMKTRQNQGSGVRSSRGRRRTKFEGDQTVLVVRVIAADGTTTANDTALSNSIFGNGVGNLPTLASQFKACSYGKLNLVKADVPNVPTGVVTVRLPSVGTAQGDGAMRNAITKELSEMFGVDSPSQLANYVMYCLPAGTFGERTTYSTIAYAFYNSWLSVFNDDWCLSLSLQMHEIGHSMNFGHSNEEGTRYGDESGYMGYSYPNRGGPRRCFNAAKSWQSGWYRDKGITINSDGATTCFEGILHGISDYPVATTVLLKIRNRSNADHFVNFNARYGINRGSTEGGDRITVASRLRGPRDSFAESEMVAKLGSGESYAFSGYEISVGRIDTSVGTAEVTVLPTGQDGCSIPLE